MRTLGEAMLVGLLLVVGRAWWASEDECDRLRKSLHGTKPIMDDLIAAAEKEMDRIRAEAAADHSELEQLAETRATQCEDAQREYRQEHERAVLLARELRRARVQIPSGTDAWFAFNAYSENDSEAGSA